MPNKIESENIKNRHLVLDLIEHASQLIYIALLIFITTNHNVSIQSIYVIGMAILLLFYYVLWILLFTGKKNGMILMAMSIFPVVYFVLGEILLQKFFAIIPTVIFGIVHTRITYIDFYLVRQVDEDEEKHN